MILATAPIAKFFMGSTWRLTPCRIPLVVCRRAIRGTPRHITINVGAALMALAASDEKRSSNIGSARAIMPAAQGIPIIMLILMPKLMFSSISALFLSLYAAAIAGTIATATA